MVKVKDRVGRKEAFMRYNFIIIIHDQVPLDPRLTFTWVVVSYKSWCVSSIVSVFECVLFKMKYIRVFIFWSKS